MEEDVDVPEGARRMVDDREAALIALDQLQTLATQALMEAYASGKIARRWLRGRK
jgi:hypothetical protein